MKNACVVVKKGILTEDCGENAIFRAFSSFGYEFHELRILFEGESTKVPAMLKALRAEYDNILLLVDKSSLSFFQKGIEGVFSQKAKVTDFADAGIFADGERSLFLASLDETETGVGFVKNVCAKYLQKKYGLLFEREVVRTVGASETRIKSLLAEAERLCDGKIRFFRERKFDEDVTSILYDSTTPKMTVDGVLRLLLDGLGDTVYAMNDVSLEEQLVQLLKIRGKKLSVAESFTGGGIAKRITSVSGASEVYFEGVNTYAEGAKIKRLGVSEYGLKTVGAVSDQTAYEMALGLLNTGDCDISIATTGLAGPKSDRSALPVGLCFIAVGTKEKIFVYRYKFDGNRKEITEKAINYALFLAYKQLKTM